MVHVRGPLAEWTIRDGWSSDAAPDRHKQIGVGAVDVQDPKVESGELVAERIRANRWLAPEQTIITSSCGMNHLPRITAFGKLRAMTEAKRNGTYFGVLADGNTRKWLKAKGGG